MKVLGPLAAALLAISASAPAAAAADPTFQPVPLPAPQNWIYKEKLGYRIIDVSDAPYEDYNIYQWFQTISEKCIDTPLCQGFLIYTG